MKQKVKRYRPRARRKETVRLRTVPVRVKPGLKALLGVIVAALLGLLVAQKTALQELNYRIADLESQLEDSGKKLRNAQLQYQQLISFQRINQLATTRLGMVSRSNQPVVILVGETGHDLCVAAGSSIEAPLLTMKE